MEMKMTTAHTETPWYADKDGCIWCRNPSELYQNGGGVAGDKPIAIVNIGWNGENETGYPVDANTKFIVRACNSHDDLVKALSDLLKRYTSLVASGDAGDWDAETEAEVIASRAALSKAGAA